MQMPRRNRKCVTQGSGRHPEVGGWETGFGDKGEIEDSGSLELVLGE